MPTRWALQSKAKRVFEGGYMTKAVVKSAVCCILKAEGIFARICVLRGLRMR